MRLFRFLTGQHDPHARPLDAGGPEGVPYDPFPPAALRKSVWDRFETVARQHAQRPAVADDKRELSYQELTDLSRDIAGALAALLPAQPGPVAILMRHEARYPAAILGVLAAGHICVPLDASHPAERNRLIAEHAGVIGIVSAGGDAKRADGMFSTGVPLLNLRTLNEMPKQQPRRRPRPDDVACIIYTSGSTGAPKGVYQNHRGVLHDLMQSVNTAHMNPDDRVSLMYSPGLIAGLRTTLGALLCGASIHVLAPLQLGPNGLVREIRRRRITYIRSSPSLLRSLADGLREGECLDSVRLVLLGGERIDWSDYDVVRRVCGPQALLTANLGATECWTIHSQWFVDESKRGDGIRLPVGHGVPERRVRLLREDGSEAPVGETGEFVVTSRYNALGYWRDPEQTARAFVPAAEDQKASAYRTGDLGVRRPDGLLECLGRKDQQIKISGRRVEPGEIEAVLRECRGVRDAAIIVRNDASGTPRSLTACIEHRPGFEGLLSRHFKAMLHGRLPRHLIPARILTFAELPRLASFKVDRAALERIDAERSAVEAAQPRDRILEKTCTIFRTVLEISSAPPDDNLYSLGGDSLQAIKLLLELEKQFRIPIPPEVLESKESIAELAAWIRGARHRQRRDAKAPPVAATGLSDLTNIVDGLLQAGRLDAAAREAARLKDMHPATTYGRDVHAILHKLPPMDESQIPFSDDVTRDFQVAIRPGADTALLVFAGRHAGIGIPMSVAHRWFGRLPANILYLRDFTQMHYLNGVTAFGGGRDATLNGLRELLERLGVRRILCFGNSAGTWAALHYGLDLGADAVVGLGGPVNFTRDFNMHLTWAGLAARIRDRFPATVHEMREMYASTPRPPHTLIVCADNNWDDRFHAEYMQGLPNVRLAFIEKSRRHAVTMQLVLRDAFQPVLDWLFASGSTNLPGIIPASAPDASAAG